METQQSQTSSLVARHDNRQLLDVFARKFRWFIILILSIADIAQQLINNLLSISLVWRLIVHCAILQVAIWQEFKIVSILFTMVMDHYIFFAFPDDNLSSNAFIIR